MAIDLTFRSANGNTESQLVYRDDEARLELLTDGRRWAFEADGALLRLVSERILR